MADPRHPDYADPRNPEYRDPRHPDYDPAIDPTRPLGAGPIERDLIDPLGDPARSAPYNDPRAAPARGIAGATIAIAVVLLAVFAFALMGGTDTEQASVPPGTVTEENNPATGSITPDEPVQPVPAPAPAQPAQ